MPSNKLASFRYRVINQCLKNTGRRWSLNDLIEAVSDQLQEQFGLNDGISKRTIQYDLNIMRSEPPRGFGAPISCQNSQYFYDDPHYSIDQNPLNETDMETLKESIAILKQFNQIPALKELDKIIGKMQEGLFPGYEESFIHFEQNQQYKNLAMVSDLYYALRKKVKIQFNYQPFSSKPQKISLHPYILKEYNNRWFIIGWNEEFSSHTNLPVDRIASFNLLNTPIDETHKSTIEKWLSQVVGVSIPEEREVKTIHFYVNKDTAPYIATKPLHPSQKQTGETSFTIAVMPNYELWQNFRYYNIKDYQIF